MGNVTQQEFEQLVDSVRSKAENGDRSAMKHLGDLYYQGPSGDEKNAAAAFPWWQKAADKGDRVVAEKVGHCFSEGIGCKKDEKRALYYYLLAADYTDNAQAAYTVGVFYENGIGCHPNKRKAIPYYELAALRGHPEAQWHLGMLLFTAQKPDGLHWICCAHLAGIEDATDTLNRIISNGGSAEAIQDEIQQIKRFGIKYGYTPHEYSEGLGILLSVLKWASVGFVVATISLLIVCIILQPEGSLNFLWFLLFLITGLFGYLGYWWEVN